MAVQISIIFNFKTENIRLSKKVSQEQSILVGVQIHGKVTSTPRRIGCFCLIHHSWVNIFVRQRYELFKTSKSSAGKRGERAKDSTV